MKKDLTQKVLYFAYGSNMHQPRLEARVGRVKCLGTYTLKGYNLTFDTGTTLCSFANVEKVESGSCEGIIYEMTYYQLKQLDWYEGLYERVKEEYDGRKLHIYISNKFRNKKREIQLTKEYHDVLMLGCITHNLKKSKKIISNIKPIALPPQQYYWWEEEGYY